MAKSSNTFSKAKGLGLLGSTVIAGVVVVVVVGALKLNGLLVTVDLPSSFLSLSLLLLLLLPNESLGIVDVEAAEEAVEVVVVVASDVGLLKLNVGAVLDGVAVDEVAGLMDPNVKEGVAVVDLALSSDDALAGVLNVNVGVAVDAEVVVAADTLGVSVGLLKENPLKPVLAGAAEAAAAGAEV